MPLAIHRRSRIVTIARPPLRAFPCASPIAALSVALPVSPPSRRRTPARRTGSPRRAAPTCSSTPTTRSTGIPGAPEAFEKARRRRSSSSCRSATARATGATSWSASRSQDKEVAKILNEHFVCIKVDREERPDIDEIYMTALQVLGRPRRLAAVDVPDRRRQADRRRHLLAEGGPEDRRPGRSAASRPSSTTCSSCTGTRRRSCASRPTRSPSEPTSR